MSGSETTGIAALDDDLVGGRYRLREILGTGGMGRVWLADDQLLGRPVAVKEMLGPAAGRVDLQLRTVREARAAARLDHPGVVKVFDVVWRSERAWIVMEYVRSRSLQTAVDRDGPLEHREAARIGLRVLAALRAAHAARVLHLDVKPHNVLLGDDGRVVLGDFGLAVTPDPDDDPEPVLMGSPYYMAPERIAAQGRPSPATDLWSLGATLYAAVEGRPPFARPTTEASLLAIVNEDPDPVRRPGPLTPLLLDLLAKDRDRRPAPAEVEQRLRRVADGTQAPARGQARVPQKATPGAGRRKRRYVAAGVALAGVAMAGTIGAVLVLDSRRDGAPAAARPSMAASASASVAALPDDPCGFGAGGAAVEPATTRVPAGLPSGWIWFRDPTGFALALPAGWRRSASGTAVCFADPHGRAAFTVDSAALVTRRPLDYFQSREKAENLPGYRRISMDVLLLRRGGADWEYTWRPDSDTTQHVRRVLLAVTDDRSYLLKWAAPDQEWARQVPLARQLVTLFASNV